MRGDKDPSHLHRGAFVDQSLRRLARRYSRSAGRCTFPESDPARTIPSQSRGRFRTQLRRLADKEPLRGPGPRPTQHGRIGSHRSKILVVDHDPVTARRRFDDCRRPGIDCKVTALPRKPGQAAASISYPVDFAMNSSRVWQTIADRARRCADALISAFRA